MRSRRLGSHGPAVSVIGYGAWGLSGAYGAADDATSSATIRRALDLGVTLIDTADEYGNGHNERLVGTAVGGRSREAVVISTKFGIVHHPDSSRTLSGRPEYARAALEASLQRLGVEYVDLYYLHRLDPAVPIEETVGAMADLVREGKARHLGLCEVGASDIHRAHAVHPITAIQSEYSLWTRDPERSVLPVVRALDIGFVAFAPLGRGFLTGSVTGVQAIGKNDFRRSLPRFHASNLERNLTLVERLRQVAEKHNATPGQIALAWLLKKEVVPIPGTRSIAHLEDNLSAPQLRLEDSDLEVLEDVFRPGAASGERYPEIRNF